MRRSLSRNFFIAGSLTLTFGLSLAPLQVEAAACCGGGFATPALIVGDDEAQLNGSVGRSQVLTDVDEDGIWYPRTSRETSTSFKIEGAHIAWDRFQFGGSIPLVQRMRGGRESSGLGDISGTAGYEYLPEWDYSVWRPRGFGFLQATAPTGRAANESTAAYQLDARGRGFWSMGAGTVLTKTFSKVDMFTEFDLHRSFAHDYRNAQSRGTLQPGWGGNFGLGAGYNLAKWRFGAALTWTYEDAVNVSGQNSSRGSLQRFATATLTCTYLWRDDWSSSLSYTNQAWIGNPNNTSLGEAVSLAVQKRWER